MIEKAVIFAAGEGTRLRPLTLNRPKHLLPIAGKPLIYWILKSVEYAGARKIGIVVHYKADMITSYLKTLNLKSELYFIFQHKPDGTAGALDIARDFIGDEDFLLIYGDVIVDPGDFKEMVHLFKKENYDAVILGVQVENPWDYGVLKLRDGLYMEKVVEKPPRGQEPSNLINGGVYVFSPKILDLVKKVGLSVRGERELTDALQMLALRGRVFVYKTQRSKWRDIGRPWDLLEAEARLFRMYLPPPPKCEIGCEVRVVPPVYIGENVEIGRYSTIGPNVSLHDNVKVGKFSKISNSIVMKDSKIGDYVSVSYSIIGERSVLEDEVTILSEPENGGSVKMIVKGKLEDTGMKKLGCVIGDDVVVGRKSLIKAGSVIFNNVVIPSNSTITGLVK